MARRRHLLFIEITSILPSRQSWALAVILTFSIMLNVIYCISFSMCRVARFGLFKAKKQIWPFFKKLFVLDLILGLQ